MDNQNLVKLMITFSFTLIPIFATSPLLHQKKILASKVVKSDSLYQSSPIQTALLVYMTSLNWGSDIKFVSILSLFYLRMAYTYMHIYMSNYAKTYFLVFGMHYLCWYSFFSLQLPILEVFYASCIVLRILGEK